jgi:hypothetical protein
MGIVANRQNSVDGHPLVQLRTGGARERVAGAVGSHPGRGLKINTCGFAAFRRGRCDNL